MLAVGAMTLGVLTLLSPAAQAIPPITATSTTTAHVGADTTTTMAGLNVTDPDGQEGLEITVSTDVGTLSITTTTNLTLAYGNNWSGDASISFTGTEADVNNGLATVALTTGNDGGSTAHVSITALPTATGYVYSPTNGHFYEYVPDSGITQPDAVIAAAASSFKGQTGYLASIPSAAINDLISNRLEDAVNVWFGAESVDTPGDPVQRTWEWAYGPLQGQPISYCSNFVSRCDFVDNAGLYSSWDGSEPNNSGGDVDFLPHSGEWVAATNYGSQSGLWNDFPPDIGDYAGGYVVEYGDLADGATSFGDVVTDSSAVLIDAGPATPRVPTGLTGVGGDRTLTLTWVPPVVVGSSAVTAYAVSLDNGRTWTTTRTSGTTRLSSTLLGVRKAVTYPVRVRAINASGVGVASPRLDVTIPQWFADPIGPAARAREVRIPRHLKRYHGTRHHTVATGRARDGRPAFPAKALHGHQLQSGEAVSLSSRSMFRFNRTALRPAGRRALQATVASLTYVQAVTCEGYSDYGGRAGWERTLAQKRAKVVCSALRAYGADVVTRRVSLGSTRPVVIGGSRAGRGANRRVVISITRG